MEILGIEWVAEKVPVGKLAEWTDNPRYITETEYESLKAKIKDRGLHDVLVVDQNYIVLSGNQRLKALRDLGVAEVFIMKPGRDLNENERATVALESNRSSGKWDWDKLANHFEMEILTEAGFDDFEMNIDLGNIDTQPKGFEKFEGGAKTSQPSKRSLIMFTFIDDQARNECMELLGAKKNVIDGEKLLELLQK